MGDEHGKPRLGRGLAALIGDVGDEMAVVERGRGQRRVPVEFLRPNPRNPRKSFGEEELARLASSIRERGIIQPVVVRAIPTTPDAFEIVAGERRWRAAQAAGLHDVPVVVVDVDDRTSLEFAILENVQRSDLNPIEEAAGYQRLLDEFRYTQEELAKVIGKSRSHLANIVRLLELPPSVKERVVAGEITAGHARALLSVKNPEAVARRVVEQGLTVREVEEIAYADHGNAEPRSGRPRRARPEKDPDTRAVERALEDVLGLGVSIEHKGQGGELRIRYGTLDQLDALCRRLNASAA
ncbi:MAG TPA: ParB/RepB/Spo0J family partition protein [Microvirga sp.]|jgi:ParB family chromosome partitioning protein|nr:ParB/RepB/Spo0J family partition protein [Microvirga sp.]